MNPSQANGAGGSVESPHLSGAEVKKQRLLKKLKLELGPIIVDGLNDPDVIEIMLNPSGEIWFERFGQGMFMLPEAIMSATNAEALIGTIADSLYTTVSREQPILEGELPLDGSRFEGLLPPVVAAPTFTIRKKASKVFTLDDYVAQGVMSEAQQQQILSAIHARKNILVVGGTGSGKTTLTNAVIDGVSQIHPDDRLVIIEDTAEIQCAAKNAVLLRSTVDVSMQQLLRATLRLRPDRILVGEVRGPEALALLKAWNTGHPGGVATLHANDARAGLIRLEQLVAETGLVQGIPALIGEAVDVVVMIRKVKDVAAGRRVTDVLQVQGWTEEGYKVKSE